MNSVSDKGCYQTVKSEGDKGCYFIVKSESDSLLLKSGLLVEASTFEVGFIFCFLLRFSFINVYHCNWVMIYRWYTESVGEFAFSYLLSGHWVSTRIRKFYELDCLILFIGKLDCFVLDSGFFPVGYWISVTIWRIFHRVWV